ncbi:glycosyltransferase family 4 protein [Acidiphilium acidophilum]|uniref:glycosyltransferase family 4 protein n=1 Tax=Acidiphilium acidophilum TaxID=76588 RepID=UPI002E8E75D3|nr:glycosyltransferase family 4 protein [Acidiphilium acidophilum]
MQPEEFIFLFQFDALSIPYRKNPDAVIAAFKIAFSSSDPVRLIIKTQNGDEAKIVMESLHQQIDGARITIWDASLESDDRFRLLSSADVFVSLHRAEGFGLSLAEAMMLEKPVIATAWSGNMDFMDKESACLVPYKLVPLDQDYGPYTKGTLWAEPDISAAAAAMKQLFEDRDYAKKLGQKAKVHVSSCLSEDAIAALAARRIRRLLKVARPSAELLTDEDASRRPKFTVRLMRVGWRAARRTIKNPTAIKPLAVKGIRSLREYGIRRTLVRIYAFFAIRSL